MMNDVDDKIDAILAVLHEKVCELNVRELLWGCVQSIENNTAIPSGANDFIAMNKMKITLINSIT